MNHEKYSRLSIVVDKKTDRSIRYIAAMTDRDISAVVRELISDHAHWLADALGNPTGLDDFNAYVDQAYLDHVQQRGVGNGK
jgi:limonene-1,2-epoxide hydrolase